MATTISVHDSATIAAARGSHLRDSTESPRPTLITFCTACRRRISGYGSVQGAPRHAQRRCGCVALWNVRVRRLRHLLGCIAGTRTAGHCGGATTLCHRAGQRGSARHRCGHQRVASSGGRSGGRRGRTRGRVGDARRAGARKHAAGRHQRQAVYPRGAAAALLPHRLGGTDPVQAARRVGVRRAGVRRARHGALGECRRRACKHDPH